MRWCWSRTGSGCRSASPAPRTGILPWAIPRHPLDRQRRHARFLSTTPAAARSRRLRARPTLRHSGRKHASRRRCRIPLGSLALFDDEPGPDPATIYRPNDLDLFADARDRILRRLAAMQPAPRPVRRRSAWSSTFIAGLELSNDPAIGTECRRVAWRAVWSFGDEAKTHPRHGQQVQTRLSTPRTRSIFPVLERLATPPGHASGVGAKAAF